MPLHGKNRQADGQIAAKHAGVAVCSRQYRHKGRLCPELHPAFKRQPKNVRPAMAACPGLRQVPFLPCRYGQSRPCVMPARSSPFSRAILPPSGMCHPYIRALPNVTRPLCAPDTFLLLSRSASAKGAAPRPGLGARAGAGKSACPVRGQTAWPDTRQHRKRLGSQALGAAPCAQWPLLLPARCHPACPASWRKRKFTQKQQDSGGKKKFDKKTRCGIIKSLAWVVLLGCTPTQQEAAECLCPSS